MKIVNIVKLSIVISVFLAVINLGCAFLVVKSATKTNETSKIALRTQYLAESLEQSSDLLTSEARMYVITEEKEHYDNYFREINETKTIEHVIEELNALKTPQEEFLILSKARKFSDDLAKVEMAAFDVIQNGTKEEKEVAKMKIFDNEYSKIQDLIAENIKEFTDEMTERTIIDSDIANKSFNIYLTILVALIVFNICVVCTSFYFIGRKVKNIKKVVDIANDIAIGQTSINFPEVSKDEIGDLIVSFKKMTEVIKSIVSQIDNLSMSHKDGDIDFVIDESLFDGEYRVAVQHANEAVEGYVENVNDILFVIQKYADGDFSAKLKQLPGKKSKINDVVEKISTNLLDVKRSVDDLTEAALLGKLDKTVDSSAFKGEWKTLIEGLNKVLEVVSEPLSEFALVMKKMSEGVLDEHVKGDYKGDFAVAANSINSTGQIITEYIEEIDVILSKVSKGDLRTSISKEYLGKFSYIKNSINKIINVLNKTVSDINISSKEVLEGATNIAYSSTTIAEGALEQSETIGKLYKAADDVTEKTTLNVSYTSNAKEISEKSLHNANEGETEMNDMLSAIKEIEESSKNISKIIKVIEDIAFQTNLLALNAAVEAARAGVHGKGFAVVAEEVRSLASRSQIAAKDTTELIENSIDKVNLGTKSAKKTSEALSKIVEDSNELAEIISKIQGLSNEQMGVVRGISEGLHNLSSVVNSNTSNSQTTAATSEELNSQAESLKSMIEFFKTL